MFATLPASVNYLLAALVWPASPPVSPPPQLNFHLRHAHAIASNSSGRVIFQDIDHAFAAQSSRQSGYRVSTSTVQTHRPHSFEAHVKARLRSLYNSESLPPDALWYKEDTSSPNVTDLDTIITLAEMTSNSYFKPTDSSWYDMGPDWNANASFPFGWEPGTSGTRGHVFVSTDNSTIVVSIKGTSVPIIGGGPTVPNDKLNDNLLFSCCCGRVGPTWSTVCDCYSGSGKCDLNCLERSLIEDSLFYNVATVSDSPVWDIRSLNTTQNLYNNVTYMYPDANIWVIGHSLGGSLASLLGSTFGAPVVAYEAPGERMASQRLHLPSIPSTQHITHVYNTADPIPMGVCTGVSSACAIAGYALESKCHLGKSIILDTITVLGWSSSIQNHGIQTVIDKVLNITDVDWGYGTTGGEQSSFGFGWPWGPGSGDVPPPKQPKLPPAIVVEDCVDCFTWEYGDFK